MSLISKILTHSAHARDEVRRALDPDTHEPFPVKYEPGVIVKLGAWLLETPWGARVVMRLISAACGGASVWLAAHGSGAHTESIVAGLFSALTFLSEIVISWLHKKAGRGLTPIASARSYAPAYLLPEAEEPRPSLFGANRDKPLLKRIEEKITPVTEAAPVEAALPQMEEFPPSSASGQRLAIPGALERIGFPDTAALAAEVKRLLPPAPAPALEESFTVEFCAPGKKTNYETHTLKKDAIAAREKYRAKGWLAKLLPLFLALLLVGCVVDPATGKKRYAGPNVSFTAGYQGVSAGVTLWGFYGEEKKPASPLPATVELMGIPLNTK